MCFLRNLSCTLIFCAMVLFGQADANKGQIVGTVYDAKRYPTPA